MQYPFNHQELAKYFRYTTVTPKSLGGSLIEVESRYPFLVISLYQEHALQGFVDTVDIARTKNPFDCLTSGYGISATHIQAPNLHMIDSSQWNPAGRHTIWSSQAANIEGVVICQDMRNGKHIDFPLRYVAVRANERSVNLFRVESRFPYMGMCFTKENASGYQEYHATTASLNPFDDLLGSTGVFDSRLDHTVLPYVDSSLWNTGVTDFYSPAGLTSEYAIIIQDIRRDGTL